MASSEGNYHCRGPYFDGTNFASWKHKMKMHIWYVSNVSIIYEVFMLLDYLFWMFMGFIKHFYIIFGTNLLTRGPAHIVVFLPISVFRRKGISNGVQTEWNLQERDFGNEHDPGGLELKSRKLRGGHEAGGAPTPWAHPPPLWPPRSFSDLYSKSPGFLLVQVKSWRNFYSVWTPFGIFFLRNAKTRKK